MAILRKGPIEGAPNFTYEELIRSDTANRYKISNVPEMEYIWQNLEYLARTVLQPVRDHFGVPIAVTSGYRSPGVNRAVKGASSSHHVQGCAADIRFERKSGLDESKIFAFIYENLPFTELIAEGIPSGWVHVAIVRGREDEKALKYMLDSDGRVKRGKFSEIMRYYAKPPR